ncbi:MAG: DUF6055 domain-containing protein [Bacteroidaceae bacterium]
MKKILLTLMLGIMTSSLFAQKSVYIPWEWRQQRTDTLLYAESDPENKYTWSKSRSMETDNFIIFWDKYWGNTAPNKLPSSNFYYFDLEYMKERLETFYKHEAEVLGFGTLASSNINKYKIIVCLNHTTEWTCYGSGYDYQVPALWLNPSTSKPVGSAVAHEVGHSFHYMCYSDASKQGTLDGVHTGFHDAIGNGSAIWETTANWQALYSYPEEIFTESGTGDFFGNTHNYAFTHEWHRYQAYMFFVYLCEKYNDIQTIYKVWSYPESKAKDFNEVLMDLKGLSVDELYKLHFDFAMHAVTYDMARCKPYLNDHYIGNFRYACTEVEDGVYQVAYSSCPQGTGFNVIPLQIQPAGTEITTHFTAMRPLSKLAEGDPKEYHNGDRFTTVNRNYYNNQNSSYRGFRLGYVVLKTDGSREYISEDSIYGTGGGEKTVDVSFTVPANAKQMWLVVAPSLKSYIQHKWDENVENDDQWPYRFELEGTKLGSKAIVYAPSTIDGRDVANVEFTYDVYYPAATQAGDHSGTSVSISGKALAALGTAFQMENPSSGISSAIRTYSAGAPAEGTCKFYACYPTGSNSIVSSGSTANGYGHWFDANGGVTSYGNGYVFSEFAPSTLTFTLGQYPQRLRNGQEYTIVQAIRYKKDNKIAKATFKFNIHITQDKTGAELSEIEEHTVPVGINDIHAFSPSQTAIYNLSGIRVKANADSSCATDGLAPGIYIINHKKVLVK